MNQSLGLQFEIAGSVRMPCITESRDENSPNLKATSDTIRSDEYEKPIGDCAVVTDHSYSKGTDRLQNSIALRGKRSQTALRVLLNRRNELVCFFLLTRASNNLDVLFFRIIMHRDSSFVIST